MCNKDGLLFWCCQVSSVEVLHMDLLKALQPRLHGLIDVLVRHSSMTLHCLWIRLIQRGAMDGC